MHNIFMYKTCAATTLPTCKFLCMQPSQPGVRVPGTHAPYELIPQWQTNEHGRIAGHCSVLMQGSLASSATSEAARSLYFSRKTSFSFSSKELRARQCDASEFAGPQSHLSAQRPLKMGSWS